MNNLDEYQEPEIYDAEYGSYVDDFKVFVGLKSQGYALDLACGTGRLTIALAQSGLNCVGLDASETMLKNARAKSKNLAISYIQGDMRDFHFPQTFDLITLSGNSFQALLTNDDQRRLLLRVRDHLKREGVFVFNTRNTLYEELRTTKDFEFWHDFIDHTGQLVKVSGKQNYNPEKQTVLYMTKRVWTDRETITEIRLRFTPIQDLLKTLDFCGFEVINLYGDVHKTSFTETSPSIMITCRVKS